MSKGQTASEYVFFRLIEVVLAAVAGIVLFAAISGLSTGFLQAMWVNEVGTSITATQTLSGNLFYSLASKELPVEKLKTDIAHNIVKVGTKSYSFPLNKLQSFAFIPGSTGFLEILKQGEQLTVEDRSVKTPFNALKLSCSHAETKMDIKDALIDPGHGYPLFRKDELSASTPEEKKATEQALGWDKGNNIDNTYESEAMLTIARKTNLPLTRSPEQDDAVSLAQRLNSAKSSKALISLHAGDIGTKNGVIAYVNAYSSNLWKSEKLACNILNELSDWQNNKISGVSIVQVDLSQLKENDPKQILSADNSVLIELGGTKNNQFVSNPDETAKRIKAGLVAYGK